MPKKMTRILAILSLVLVVSIALFSLGIGYKGGVRGIGLVGVMFFFTFLTPELVPAYGMKKRRGALKTF